MGISEASFVESDNILSKSTIVDVRWLNHLGEIELYIDSESVSDVADAFEKEAFLVQSEFNLTKLGQHYVAWR